MGYRFAKRLNLQNLPKICGPFPGPKFAPVEDFTQDFRLCFAYFCVLVGFLVTLVFIERNYLKNKQKNPDELRKKYPIKYV